MQAMTGLIESLRHALLLSLLCCCWWGCWLTFRCGPERWGQVSGMRFIYLHLHINLLNWRLGLCRNCNFIAIQSAVWVYFWLCVFCMKNVNFCCQVAPVWVCVCVWDRKRKHLPPNWYDVWHFIYCSWPERLIMLPKAIKTNHTQTHTFTVYNSCKDMHTHMLRSNHISLVKWP